MKIKIMCLMIIGLFLLSGCSPSEESIEFCSSKFSDCDYYKCLEINCINTFCLDTQKELYIICLEKEIESLRT